MKIIEKEAGIGIYFKISLSYDSDLGFVGNYIFL